MNSPAGSFVNQAGGTIGGGQYGVYIESVTGTLTNFGLISGQIGVYGREVVANGSQYKGQVTIINAGTITGSGGTALSLFASNDLLIDEPGSVFNGAVNGGGGRLELAVGGIGTIGALATSLATFSTVTVDGGATWALTGGLAPGGTLVDQGVITISNTSVQARGLVTGGGTIAIARLGALSVTGSVASGTTIAFTNTSARIFLSHGLQDSGTQTGFSAGDTIFLSTVSSSGLTKSYSGNASSGVLTLSQAGTVVSTLNFLGNYNAGSFSLAPDTAGGTDVLIPCFLAGTRIAIEQGAMRVELLRAGMRVLTAAGALREVVWVGRRAVDIGRHADPGSVRPVRILRGAFAPGVPERDLLLSPDHAVLHGGVLIPVHLLVNGGSVRCETVGYARYHHVELASHDILLAEGLAVESYLDTGNRGWFGDAAADGPRPLPCAPLVLGGAAVARARRHLLSRSLLAGGGRRVVEPRLRVSADGRAVLPVRREGHRLLYLLPAETHSVEFEDGGCVADAILDGRRIDRAGLRRLGWGHAARSLELVLAEERAPAE